MSNIFFQPKISDLDKKCHFSSAISSVKNNGVTLISKKWTSCYLKTLISRSSGGVGRTTAALDKLLYMLGVHWNSFWGNRAAGSARTEPWYFFLSKLDWIGYHLIFSTDLLKTNYLSIPPPEFSGILWKYAYFQQEYVDGMLQNLGASA